MLGSKPNSTLLFIAKLSGNNLGDVCALLLFHLQENYLWLDLKFLKKEEESC